MLGPRLSGSRPPRPSRGIEPPRLGGGKEGPGDHGDPTDRTENPGDDLYVVGECVVEGTGQLRLGPPSGDLTTREEQEQDKKEHHHNKPDTTNHQRPPPPRGQHNPADEQHDRDDGQHDTELLEQVESRHQLPNSRPRDQLHRSVDSRNLISKRHPLGDHPLLEPPSDVPKIKNDGIPLNTEAATLIPPQHGENLGMHLLVDRHPQLLEVGAGNEVVNTLLDQRLGSLRHLGIKRSGDLPSHRLLNSRIVSKRSNSSEITGLRRHFPNKGVGSHSGSRDKTPQDNKNDPKGGTHAATLAATTRRST